MKFEIKQPLQVTHHDDKKTSSAGMQLLQQIEYCLSFCYDDDYGTPRLPESVDTQTNIRAWLDVLQGRLELREMTCDHMHCI